MLRRPDSLGGAPVCLGLAVALSSGLTLSLLSTGVVSLLTTAVACCLCGCVAAPAWRGKGASGAPPLVAAEHPQGV